MASNQYYCEFCGITVSPEYDHTSEAAQEMRYCQDHYEETLHGDDIEQVDRGFHRYISGRR